MKQDYLTYTAEELAQDTAFIRWVRAENAPSATAWEVWLQAHPQQADKVAVAKALVRAVSWETPELSATRKREIWATIDSATSGQPAKTVPLTHHKWWTWAAAASVALLLGIAWWATNATVSSEQTLQTAKTETLEEVLPDGSVVHINAVSRLTYQPQNWQHQRTVNLEGEAFFEVEKGVPFLVKTPAGQVEVLGTSFNVEARDGIFRVLCYTGKVSVTTTSGQTSILTPQQGAFWEGSQLRVRTINDRKDIAWQTQMHHFTNAPLAEVMAALERQYPVSITYPDDLSERQYSGFFKSGNLEEALQGICWPLNLRFTIENDQVTIFTNDE